MVMVTREHGKAMYIAPMKNLRTAVTENRNQAELWSAEHDQSKLLYYRIETGWEQLNFEQL